ncbi:MAG: type II toxin-antitoxin system HigB family toxin [Symploca sp. SIO1B1]|nr:type II toxin-antitoxin system HigB family toxin [Symploca sp. SIO1B1]
MRVINTSLLADFIAAYPDAETPLDVWLQTAQKAEWKHLMEIKATWSRSTDFIAGKTVFDIRGNKYRLITKINYKLKIVRICYVLTHEEYNTDKWKLTEI